VAELHEKFRAPIPYYALLEADGDGIGHLLKQTKTEAARASLVQALYEFAQAAWAIINERGGCPFYVGGDEVCAYVPADEAVAVVEQLSRAFADLVGDVAERLLPEEVAQMGPATLTAGVVIAHVYDDLRAVRRWTHVALERAKSARRAAWAGEKVAPIEASAWGFVALEEAPRGGSNRRCCGAIREIAARNAELRALLAADHVSLSLAHDFLTLADEMAPPMLSGASPTCVGLGLARALLPQKLTRNNKLIEPAAKVQRRIVDMTSWDQIRELAAEMLLAERMLRVAAQRQEEV
jgi:CRISPR-associated protein Cmr2